MTGRTRTALGAFAAVAVGAVSAAPALATPPPTLTVTSTGAALSVAGTPAAGAVRFAYRYTGSRKGESNLVVVALKRGVTPEQFIARVRALGPHDTPEALLLQTGTLITGQTVQPRVPGPTTITKLAPGSYVVLDTAPEKPSNALATSFTVPADGARADMPRSTGTITMRDYRFSAPNSVRRGARLKIVNRGDELHFVVAISVPPGLTDRQAVRALRKGNEKPFAKSTAAGVLGLVSPGATNLVTPKFTRGRWLLACYYANRDSHGMPHTMLGMEKVVHVR